MAEATGHPCPECGVPREPDNTPACVCAQRASDALRDARTAQAAAAEDFDPLRIRPYVDLAGPAPQDAAEGSPRELPAVGGQVPPAEATMPLRPAPTGAADTAPGAYGAAPGAPGATAGAGGAPGATPAESRSGSAPGAPSAVPGAGGADPQSPDPGRTSVLPTPLGPATSAPSDTDLRLFEAAEVEGAGPEGGDGGDGRPRRRRRGLLLGAAAAGVVAVAAAGYASGLFSYETPTRDSALPSDLRASVPDVPADAPSETASTSAPPSASQTSASPSASVGESASPSPSPSRSSASPSPSTKPAEQSAPAPTVTATGTLSSDPDDDRPAEGTVLRRGDRGPEVTELQLRLRQLYLYTGEANGRFNNQVEDALRTYQWSRGVETGEGQLGVYGPDTRRSLESETREP